MLGAGQRIHDRALPLLKGKRIRIFPDYDQAGIKAARIWDAQLRSVDARLDFFDYTGLKTVEGEQITDFNEFLHIDPEQWETIPEARWAIPSQ